MSFSVSSASVRRDYSFAGLWNGRFFQTKQVRPIFVEDADEIVVVTVCILTTSEGA